MTAKKKKRNPPPTTTKASTTPPKGTAKETTTKGTEPKAKPANSPAPTKRAKAKAAPPKPIAPKQAARKKPAARKDPLAAAAKPKRSQPKIGPAPVPPDDAPRVLVAHPDVEVLRFVRETLGGLTDAAVDTSPNAERAFELALQRSYQLFLFDFDMPGIRGEVLYELIEKAYRFCASPRFPPAIVFYMGREDAESRDALRRDARVRGTLVPPLAIDRLLGLVDGLFTVREVAR